MSTPTLLHSPKTLSPSVFFAPRSRTRRLFSFQTLPFFRNLPSLCCFSLSSSSFQSSFQSPFQQPQQDDEEDDHVIGDCLVFEDGIFEDPYLQQDFASVEENPKSKKPTKEIKAEDLVPDSWKEIVDEINMTKKDRRKVAQQMEYGARIEKKKRGYMPVGNVNVNVGDYLTYREAKLGQLKPVVLDNPTFAAEEVKDEEEGDGESRESEENGASSSRVAPKNPRWAVYGGTLEDISEFFNSADYEPGRGSSAGGRRKLFTKEEKVLLNKRIPDLAVATSGKWLPLHTLTASGEFYLMDALLKHNVDINGADKDGLTALHRAIISKKQAVMNYLLRESANPFVRDDGGASLMHYAVQAASIPSIKVLLLYNVDINLQDNDGWTPLHVAVQARRTDIVRLLLIKGANKTLKNRDGLTPLDLCLYTGRDVRNYEVIKLLEQLPNLIKKVDRKLNSSSILPLLSAGSNKNLG